MIRSVYRSKTILAVIAIVTSLIVFTAGCEKKLERKPFRMAIVTWVGFGPWYIAQEKGFFEREGITVELVRIEDFGARRGALSSGKLEGSVETTDSFAIGLAEGLPAVQVLKIDDSYGGDGLVAKKNIASIKDLKGKVVAYSKGSPSHFFLLYLLKKEGMSSEDIQSQFMEAGEAGAAFVGGKVDAAVTWEPWLSKANENPEGKVLLTSKEVPGLISDTYVVHEDVTKNRPEDVKKILRAWFSALKFLRENKEEAIEIMSRNLGIDKDEMAAMLEGIKFPSHQENLDFFGIGGKENKFLETFNAAAAIWQEEGFITKVPDGKTAYDSGFLEALYQ
ncbi:MAG: ABC transporter substrate-binding protein [Thermodesulfobacteriota bacterium]